jgi:hypothetical protein
VACIQTQEEGAGEAAGVAGRWMQCPTSTPSHRCAQCFVAALVSNVFAKFVDCFDEKIISARGFAVKTRRPTNPANQLRRAVWRRHSTLDTDTPAWPVFSLPGSNIIHYRHANCVVCAKCNQQQHQINTFRKPRTGKSIWTTRRQPVARPRWTEFPPCR